MRTSPPQPKSDAIAKYLERRRKTVNSAEHVIPKRSNPQIAEASEEQRRIWLHCALNGRTELYNEPFVLQYKGELDTSAFERAFNEVLRRHAAWRTSFELRNDRVLQNITPELQIRLPLVDLAGFSIKEAEERATDLLRRDSKLPFELEQAPLFRAQLVRVAEQDFRFMMVAHHLISDGVSIYQLFPSELQACYAAFVNGKEPSLPPVPIEYPDYAEWQRTGRAQTSLDKTLQFWEQKLGGGLPVMKLPLDRPRPTVRLLEGGAESFCLSNEVTQALQSIADSCQATLFMTLLAALNLVLYNLGGDCDQVVSSPSSTRKQSGTENLLGLFINTVVLRTKFSPADPFVDLIRRVRETVLEALTHEIAYEVLVNRLPTASGGNSLFQVMFVWEPSPARLPSEWQVLEPNLADPLPKTDLHVQVQENHGQVTGRFVYARDMFDPSTIARIRQRWTEALSAVAANPNRSVEEISDTLNRSEAHRKSPLQWLRRQLRSKAS